MTLPQAAKIKTALFRTCRGNLSSEHCKSTPSGSQGIGAAMYPHLQGSYHPQINTSTLAFLRAMLSHVPLIEALSHLVTECTNCTTCMTRQTFKASLHRLILLYISITVTVTATWMSFVFQGRCINTHDFPSYMYTEKGVNCDKLSATVSSVWDVPNKQCLFPVTSYSWSCKVTYEI